MSTYMNKSPEGYGLLAQNTNEGFVAMGLDGEMWMAVNDEGVLEWQKTSDVNESPIKSTGLNSMNSILSSPRGCLLKKHMGETERLKISPGDSIIRKRAGKIKAKSSLMWIGDPVAIFKYAKSHTLDDLAKDICLEHVKNPGKKHIKLSQGILVESLNPEKNYSVNYLLQADTVGQLNVKMV